MSVSFTALILAIAALFTAPAMLWLARGSSRLRSGLDGFVLVVVTGVVLLHLGPHALMHGGMPAILGIGMGLMLPAALHRAGRPGWWTGSAMTLLGAHALIDGAALAMLDARLTAGIGVAVVAHRLPVGLAIVTAARRVRDALAALATLAAMTLVGFAIGDGLTGVPDIVQSLTEGLIVGGLLHVVMAHGEPSSASTEPASPPSSVVAPSTIPAVSFSAVSAPAAMALAPAHTQASSCGFDEDGVCLHHGDGGHSHTHQPANARDRSASAMGAVLGLVCLALLAALASQTPGLAHLDATGRAFVSLTVTSSPALLAGFILAGLISSFLDPARAGWLSGGSTGSQALRGVAFGLPLPICSCGVVPMYQSLIKRGVPMAAALAFLVATPELGIDAVMLSVPLLGVPLTLTRVIAAFGVACAVGVLVGRASSSRVAEEPEAPPAPRSTRVRLREGLRYGLGELVDHTLPWILVGLALAALVEPLLNHDLLATMPSTVQVPLAALLGVPLYVCASGATPLAAVALHKGLSAGAALAFLLAGPATNVTTFGVLSALHGRKLAIRFGLVLTLSAILLGWAVDWIGVSAPVMSHPDQLHEHGWGWIGPITAGAIVLLALGSLWRQGARGMARQILVPIHI